jgi:hypothetical protein
VIDVVFGLAISIASEQAAGSPRIVDDPWVNEQIAAANDLFGPAGVRFRWTVETPLPEPHGELHSRTDRDVLTKRLERNLVNVFLVRDLEDVDEPGRYRMGVTWTSRIDQKRFIVVARSAKPTVLAHELGHLFGNQHTTVDDNLMSYSRDGGTVFIDARQETTIGSFAERFLADRTFVDVGVPRRFW